MTDLNEFAPYPKIEDEVTADALARHIAVGAHGRQEFLNEYMHDGSTVGKCLYSETLGAFVSEYGVVFLLRELAEADPVRADAAARRLFNDWEDGGAIVERLWGYVLDYGFNPDEVSRAAEVEARKSAAKLKGAA